MVDEPDGAASLISNAGPRLNYCVDSAVVVFGYPVGADEWVDHAEYVRRKPLFDKIHSLSKALKDKDEKIEAVSKYAQKAAEVAREKAIKEY